MKFFFSIYVALSAYLCTGLNALEKASYSTITPGVLKIGSSFSNPPFINRQKAGLEVDLLNAICKQLKLRCEWVEAAPNQIMEGLDNQQYDLIADGLVMEEGHQQVIDFSIPYLVTHLSLVVSKLKNSSIKSVQELRGKSVGVLSRTAEEEGARQLLNDRQIGKMVIYPFGDMNEALKDLEKGQIDAFLLLYPHAYLLVKEKGSLKILGSLPKPIQKMAFGFSKRNPEFLAAFNRALQQVQRDGTYAKIYKKWFHEAPAEESPNSRR
ncbi:substrate-binding periplasmic protein [Parachlamydia acanthamoebae]|jgi:ABC-type amino acid transport substrate-binding protein|uniref:substrate-binding periplasmic protein n=1 Tax=Parachlamydia acanthamoebae TaxID=83552 RepID=UPI0024E2025D|nr:transporter substrate-binding domain-containing protein [Parachlamydia acanthamoebae]